MGYVLTFTLGVWFGFGIIALLKAADDEDDNELMY